MKSQSGFTLVEVVVASVLSTVIAAAVMSSLYMTNTQISEGSASQRLTQTQIVVSEQIKQKARIAYGVKRAVVDGPGPLSAAALSNPLITGLGEVFFCNPAGDTLAGYRIALGVLYEWKGGTGDGFFPFLIGSDSVSVNMANSEFRILPRRRGVIIKLNYQRTESGTTYSFPTIQETVICRNNNL